MVVHRYMAQEGAEYSEREINFRQLLPSMLLKDFVVPQDMHVELMWGYAAAVSFVDYQVSSWLVHVLLLTPQGGLLVEPAPLSFALLRLLLPLSVFFSLAAPFKCSVIALA